MRLYFILLFICNSSIGQNISGFVLDSITKSPLELVSVTLNKTNQGVFTSVNGEFKIGFKASDEYCLISHLGYKEKIIRLNNYIERDNEIFYLEPIIQELNEVFVSNDKKISYSWPKQVNLKRENVASFGFQFGTENCTFVENPYKRRGKIKTVVIDISKTAEYVKRNREWKIDYFASLKIKFYKFNTHHNKPGEEISNEEIIVEPQNKNYKLSIDVDSLNIPFLKEGVCVGVEIINTKYKEPKRVFATLAPSFNFTESRSFHPIMAWSRYRYDSQEFEFKRAPVSSDRKGRKYNMMIIDLIVEIEK